MSSLESSVPGRLATGFSHWATRRRLLVLAYHGVDDRRGFAEQLRVLVARRRPVALDDVVRASTGGLALPPSSVLVTFDDGERSLIEDGLPVLSDLGVPAAAFVVTDLLGTDDPPWWTVVDECVLAGGTTSVAVGDGATLVRELKQVPDDVRRRAVHELLDSIDGRPPRRPQLTVDDLVELERGGVAIGSHTATHPCLDRCEPDVVADELVRSREALEEHLRHPVTAMAYPNGNVTASVRQQTLRAGYGAAFLFDHRLSANPPLDPLMISRVRVDSTTSPERFRLLISGAHSAIHHARGRA